MNVILALVFFGFVAFCFIKAIVLAIKPKKESTKSTKTNVEEAIQNTEVVDTFDEEYLSSVAEKSIAELCDFGMSKEDAEHFLDKLTLCTTEENYLFLIESCQKKRVSLRDERVKTLSEKLESKAAKGVNPDTIAMIRDCLETATTKEQLDRVEQHIAKLRASSKKPANVVKKPAPKKSKTA